MYGTLLLQRFPELEAEEACIHRSVEPSLCVDWKDLEVVGRNLVLAAILEHVFGDLHLAQHCYRRGLLHQLDNHLDDDELGDVEVGSSGARVESFELLEIRLLRQIRRSRRIQFRVCDPGEGSRQEASRYRLHSAQVLHQSHVKKTCMNNLGTSVAGFREVALLYLDSYSLRPGPLGSGSGEKAPSSTGRFEDSPEILTIVELDDLLAEFDRGLKVDEVPSHGQRSPRGYQFLVSSLVASLTSLKVVPLM